MNSKQLITVAALAFVSATAFAQGEADLQHFGEAKATAVTRSAVRAEFVNARANGTAPVLAEVDAGAFLAQPQATGLTRAEVRAEVLKARANGTLAHATELQIIDDAAFASARTRADVQVGH